MFHQQMFSRPSDDTAVLAIDPNATKGLFVGDLSSFTTEKDLHQLFGTFGPILSVEIKRGRHGDSLLHGFVEFASEASSYSAIQALHNRKFKGRKMRVNWTNMKVPQTKNVDVWTLVQVHFSCPNISMKVTEEFLEAVFGPFGAVEDIIIKRHIVSTNPPVVHGYGNVYFLDTIPAMNAMVAMKDVTVNGVSFECSLTMPKSGNSFANPPAAPQTRAAPARSSAAPSSIYGAQSAAPFNSYPKGPIVKAPRGPDSRARIQGVDAHPSHPTYYGSAPAPSPVSYPAPTYRNCNFGLMRDDSQQFFNGQGNKQLPAYAQRGNNMNMFQHEGSFSQTAFGGISLEQYDRFMPTVQSRPPLPPSHNTASFEDMFTNASSSNHRGMSSMSGSVTTAATAASSPRQGFSPADCGSLGSSISKSLSNSNDDFNGAADCSRNVAFLSLATPSNDSFTFMPQGQAPFHHVDSNKTRWESWSQQPAFNPNCLGNAFQVDRHLFDLSPSPEPFALEEN